MKLILHKFFERIYKKCQSNENLENTLPTIHWDAGGMELKLPEVYDTVKALDQTIDVDYYLPGCAPPRSGPLGTPRRRGCRPRPSGPAAHRPTSPGVGPDRGARGRR